MAAAGPVREEDLSWTDVDYSVTLLDQCFAGGVTDSELDPNNYYYQHFVFRPLTREFYDNSGISKVIDTQEEFKVMMDARYFRDSELDVQIVGEKLVIKCYNPLRDDGFGLVSRTLTRNYPLPYGVKGPFRSVLSEDGILTVHVEKDANEEFDIEIDNLQGL